MTNEPHGEAHFQPLPLEISFRGLTLEQELILSQILDAFDRSQNIAEGCFGDMTINGDGTINMPEGKDPIANPLARATTAITSGAIVPITKLINDRGYHPDQAIQAVIQALTASLFLAGIEFQKGVSNPERKGNASS